MLAKLKKVPRYLYKLVNKGSFQDFYTTVKYTKTKHLLVALAARLDRKQACVEIK